jgi:hypothetical protein
MTCVYVDRYLGPVSALTVALVVEYDGGEAVRIEFPVPPPRYDREPGVVAYRRKLQRMLHALKEWERSQEAIAWRAPRKE